MGTFVLINDDTGKNISLILIQDINNIPAYLDALRYARKYYHSEYFEFTNYLNPIAEKLGVTFPEPLLEYTLTPE